MPVAIVTDPGIRKTNDGNAIVSFTNNPLLKDYSALLVKRTGEQYEIMGPNANIVKNIAIEADIDTPVVKCTIECMITKEPELFSNGDAIIINGPIVNYDGSIVDDRLVVAYIFDITWNNLESNMIIDARNWGEWLTRSDHYVKISSGETLTSLMRKTMAVTAIPTDILVETSHRLSPKLHEAKSLYDIWMDALTATMIAEAKNYYIDVTPAGVRLQQITRETSSWIFETVGSFSNLLKITRNKTILRDNFANIVRGVIPPNQSSDDIGLEGALISEQIQEINQDSIDKYGVFVANIDISRFNSPALAREELKKRVADAKEIEKVTFDTYALNNIGPLDRIYVYDPKVGIMGRFFIKTITTEISDRDFKHSIIAIRTKDIPVKILEQINESYSDEIYRDLAGIAP